VYACVRKKASIPLCDSAAGSTDVEDERRITLDESALRQKRILGAFVAPQVEANFRQHAL
jgi:hypothetical protein